MGASLLRVEQLLVALEYITQATCIITDTYIVLRQFILEQCKLLACLAQVSRVEVVILSLELLEALKTCYEFVLELFDAIRAVAAMDRLCAAARAQLRARVRGTGGARLVE